MRRSIFLAALIVASSATADDKAVLGDLARLQGLWTGNLGPNGELTTVWTVRGDTIKSDHFTADGQQANEAVSTIHLEDQAMPHKTIDTVVLTRVGGKPNGPGAVFGIYEFVDDDTIRVCNGWPDRPVEFKAPKGARRVLFTMKRVAPAK